MNPWVLVALIIALVIFGALVGLARSIDLDDDG